MKKTYNYLSAIILTIISLSTLNAQYITLDKDGYTNVRTEPNARSTIVDVVKKYQVFYDASDIPCHDIEDKDNNSPSWLLISTDMENETGYIYKKNLFTVNDLPNLCKEKWFGDETLKCSNDSVSVTISKQAYNENNKLKGKREYGTDGWTPRKEIKEIVINYKGKKMRVPESQFKNYYDVGYISAWLGFDSEIYLLFSGGDGSGGYQVMLSIVDGKVVYSIVSKC